MTGENARDRARLTLTVLGATSPYPGPGTAGPGYLVEGYGARILLDCGNGALSRLVRYCDFAELDALVLSHLHFDHCSDALVLRYALDAAVRTGRLARPLPVHCPRAPEEVFDLMSYKEAMRAEPIEADRRVAVGGLTLAFVPVRHTLETYGVVFTPAESAGHEESAPGGGRTERPALAYTADTEWFGGLPERLEGCGILLAESSLAEEQAGQAPVVGHLTIGQAARLGAMTGAARVVLTHYPPGRRAAETRAEAKRALTRPIVVATEGTRVTWP